MKWYVIPIARVRALYLFHHVGRILVILLMAVSAFMFLFGIGLSANEMISTHDSSQNIRLSVLESQVATLNTSVSEIKAEMSKRVEAKGERSLYLLGTMISTMGAFGAAVVSAILSARVHRRVNGKSK